MPNPELRKNFVDQSSVGPLDLPADEYNLNAARTDEAWDMASLATFPVEVLSNGFMYPHRLMPGASVAMVSGRIQLDFFKSPETANRNFFQTYCGATPNSGTAPTMIKFGIYKVEANSDLTRIAITNNDTALFTTAFGFASKQFTAPCPLVRGSWYAMAKLIITTGTICTMWGVSSMGAGMTGNMTPKLVGQVNAQTDLPASIAAASVVAAASAATMGIIIL